MRSGNSREGSSTEVEGRRRCSKGGEDDRHLLEEVVVGAADGKGGNGGAGMLGDAFFN